jgi:hypothetical protein
MLTALRTAAMSAVAARHLAPAGAQTMAIIGNGAHTSSRRWPSRRFVESPLSGSLVSTPRPHAARCVWWLHQHQDHAGQPIAPLACLDGLRAAHGTPPHRPRPHRARGGKLQHDPPQAAEDRRRRHQERPPHQDRPFRANWPCLFQRSDRRPPGLRRPRPAPTPPSSASPTPNYPTDRATSAGAAPLVNNTEPEPAESSAKGATARHA